MPNWNPKIPLNPWTVLLCLLAGTALSLPVGSLTPWLIFSPPQTWLYVYVAAAVTSWLALTIWLVLFLFDIRRFSFPGVLLLLLLILLVFLMFPAIPG